MSLVDNNFPARRFLTPPPTCKSHHLLPPVPASERKYRSNPPELHKLPSQESPYGKAKHVQLVDKNPNKAVSMFWKAINSGDRVDSALKDMAVVMKQLNRSDEAIEAIRSFRHLCPSESQESLDNLLVELYKTSGRTEEQIQILQLKLKQIEEGLAFGGKRYKSARSQGKKIEITIEQEYARLLGNLAWAYLLQSNFKSAEEMYRKSLSFEHDKNKQCNLAICLMHMHRMTEAKILLRIVRNSSENREMDESYAKSYEHAVDIMAELESHVKKLVAPAEQKRVNIPMPFSPFTSRDPEGCFIQNSGQKRGFSQFAGANKANSPGPINWFQSSPQNSFGDKGNKTSFGSQWNVKWGSKGRTKESFMYNKENVSSPASEKCNSEVLLTQPRRCTWSFGNEEQKRAMVQDVHRKLIFGQPVDAAESTVKSSDSAHSTITRQPTSDVDNGVKKSNNNAAAHVETAETVEQIDADSEANHDIQSQPKSPRGTNYQDFFTCMGKKSWADMAEEEEQEMLNGISIFQGSSDM